MFSARFIDALAQHDARVDYLLTAQGEKFSSGISTTITRRWSTHPLFLSNPFRQFVGLYEGNFSVRRSMQGVLEGENSVQGFPSYTSFSVLNHKKELDNDWGGENGYNTSDQPITLEALVSQRKYGKISAQVFSGIAGTRNLSDQRMEIPVSNTERLLNSTQIATRVIDATDFPNAPEANFGQPIALTFGTIKHLPLQRIHKSIPIYLFSERVSSAPMLYSNGAPYSPSDYTLDLDASGGSIVTFPDTLDPAGTIVTADVEGSSPSNKLVDIGKTILGLAGIDTTAMDAVELQAIVDSFDFDMSLPLYGPITASQAMQQLTSGIPDFFSENRDGTFVWGVYRPPSGTPEITIANDIEVFEGNLQEETPTRGFIFEYDPIEQILEGANLAGVTAEEADQVARLSQGFLRYTTPDSPHLPEPTRFEQKSYRTRIVNRADVVTLGTYNTSLYGRFRSRLEVEMRLQALAINGINSVVDITRPRIGVGYQGSHLWRVIEMQEEHRTRSSRIRLLLRD